MIQIADIEVWACGGIENLQYQAEQKQREQKRIDKARKVDKAEFVNSDFDKEFLLEGTFKHSAQKEDR